MENRGIESRDARRARQKHNRRRSLWILLFLAVCAGVVIALLTAPIFQIQEVYFVGNSRLTQEQLLETAAITPQQNIFAVNLSNVKKRIMEIPYVSDVDIQREFPNKIRITVHENQAAAYLYLEDQLAVIDLDGKVLELVTDAAQIQSVVQALPVSEDAEADAAASPQPSAAIDPSASPAADDTEEEADTAAIEEADTASPDTEAASEPADASPDPSAPPAAEPAETPMPVQAAYSLPVVYGVTTSEPAVGKTLTDQGTGTFTALLGALKHLEEAGLLERTTKIDVSDMTDVKLWIENRLELWVGSLDNFEYKSLFAAKVIEDNISAYEKAVMDFRGDKLYVRAPGSLTPKATAEPDADSDETPPGSPEPEESQPPATDAPDQAEEDTEAEEQQMTL